MSRFAALLDELEHQVDELTLARALSYVREGNVVAVLSEPLSPKIVGLVRGTGTVPYDTTVTVTRSPDGGVTRFRGTCSCPVGEDCKHAVALLLVDALATDAGTGRALGLVPPGATDSTPSGRPPGRLPVPPRWETSLLEAMPLRHRSGPDPLAPAGDDDAGIALQFDLVESVPRAGAVERHLRVRLALRGRTGRWSRTGVSWYDLDYAHFRFRSRPGANDYLPLLRELRVLATVGRPSTAYATRDLPVWLDLIESRRVWDLLAEAAANDLPLLDCQRQPQPVILHAEPVTATLDVRRGTKGAALGVLVRQGDRPLEYDGCLAIGSTVHGLAWWTVDSTGSEPWARLELAPRTGAVHPALARLLDSGPITVPKRDTPRFLEQYLTQLVADAPVTSSDGSVTVPEVAPRRLTLRVGHLGGHGCTLEWGWSRQIGTYRQWAPLRSAEGRRSEDPTGDAVALEAARAAMAGVPGAVEDSPTGERLAERVVLSGPEAARFVAEVLPGLTGRDDVAVEVDPDLPDFRAAATAPVVLVDGAEAGADGGTDDWFDLMVRVTVDDEEVPFGALFSALAAGETHLVLPSGTYFPLDSQELRQLAALIEEARTWADGPPGAVRISRYQASWWEELQHLGVLHARARVFEENVRTLAGAFDVADQPVPEGLHAKLRDYQLAGFHWLAHLHRHRLGGILADDMGLGKTIQALALMAHVREADPDAGPFLVVAPTSVVGNWASEAARFVPGLRTAVLGETSARRGTAVVDEIKDADLVVTSYALLRLDLEPLAEVEWEGLVLDEAQFVKNHASQAHRSAQALDARFKLAITGTPMENNVLELWALLAIVAPGLLGDVKRFTRYYRAPIEKQGDAERLAQLRRRIRPLMLRRTKEQVASELPPRVEQVLEVDLHPTQRKAYQTYLQRERQRVLGLLGDFNRNRVEILRSLTVLRQAALDVSLVDERHTTVPSTKLDLLTDMVEEIVDDGHRVLVFSQFTRFLGRARDRLAATGLDLCYLDGRTRARAKVIERFRTGDVPVFLISLKAGGFGLNLAEADYCILLDPWWNPATEAQAVDRAHRIGQKRTVMVYRMIAQGTIEEKVMALKEKKRALFANVLDSGEFESAAISADDIRGLLE